MESKGNDPGSKSGDSSSSSDNSRKVKFPLRKTGSEPNLTRREAFLGAKPQFLLRKMDDEPSGVLPVDVDVVEAAPDLISPSESSSPTSLSRGFSMPSHLRYMRSSPSNAAVELPWLSPDDGRRHKGTRVLQMQEQTMDWQTTKHSVLERNRHLLETGLWSDCKFLVGLPPNVKSFKCHKMMLAMASPVFEAMFFGGHAAAGTESEPIKILDVQPDAFQVMIEYIYTDAINLTSFELVCDSCYSAKKYMLPSLADACTKYLWRDLYPRNACKAYEFAKLFDESVLMEKGLQIIQTQTKETLSEPTFEDVEHSTLTVILSQESINVDEGGLFEAMVRWADKECERRGLEPTGQKKRQVLGDSLFLIRYLTFAPADFAAGPAGSDLLTQEESFSVLMNISAPGSWPLQDHLSRLGPRQPPASTSDLAPGASSADVVPRHWCKRAMMQEPHCLNTSILDCSVTFTVNADVCIHGIEVPSQASSEAASSLQREEQPGSEYNELLYAHLLDADGNRLTYTHFTAKVARNSMMEITFNRSVCVKANRVYRVGMVLNKVGWYPMGVCTRRVNCEGCFFTFCVGQPTDTQRDGLIRSVVFSK